LRRQWQFRQPWRGKGTIVTGTPNDTIEIGTNIASIVITASIAITVIVTIMSTAIIMITNGITTVDTAGRMPGS
jgi:hypothetical protein